MLFLYLYAAAGHYLILENSDRRAGMSAALITPFMDTTNMCLEMWVKFLGSGYAAIKVTLIQEDQRLVPFYRVSVDTALVVFLNYISLRLRGQKGYWYLCIALLNVHVSSSNNLVDI